MNREELEITIKVIEILFGILGIIFSILLAIIIYLIVNKNNINKNHINKDNKQEIETGNKEYLHQKSTEKEYTYQKSYEPKYLLTINEKHQYRKISKWANTKNYIVFCKVRLLDLITPRKYQENYKSNLWKIQAKHVDFVICDQNINVKCIIEINDNSHKTPDRVERDMFVKNILEACGYKVLMTYNITDELLDNFFGYNTSTTDEQKPPCI